MTALRMAESGECRRRMFSAFNCGYVAANAAGIMAKYFATSLAMLKVDVYKRQHTLLHFHLRPINQIVFLGPYSIKDERSHLRGSFTLRDVYKRQVCRLLRSVPSCCQPLP